MFFIELLAALMLCLGSVLVIQLLRAADADGPLELEEAERSRRQSPPPDYRRAA